MQTPNKTFSFDRFFHFCVKHAVTKFTYRIFLYITK
nr:MAG TPA: hypothetical protein [Caudoviricetes sp.]